MEPDATPGALMRRAFALHQAGDVSGAETLYHRILEIAPQDHDAQYLLGTIAQQRGRLDEAAQRIDAAIRSNGSEPEFHRSLAAVRFAQGRWQEVADSCRRAIALEAGDARDWDLLGQALGELGAVAEAKTCFERAIELAPQAVAPLARAAWALRELGQTDESIALFRRALALQPRDLDLLSTYLFSLNFSTRLSREEIFREHLACERLLNPGPPPAEFATRLRAPRPRLRVGYLSPDLRLHAVAMFLEPLLAEHDRDRFEVICFSLHARADAVTAHLRKLSDGWIDCAGLTDAQIAGEIAQAKVDILVDLAGHTEFNRIGVFGLRPAPVTVGWLGYLNTTGTRAMQYRITDRHSDPPGATEQFHTETLLRMPESQWCRYPPRIAVDVSPLPAATAGHVRFASFSASSKVTGEALALWVRALAGVPGSRLLLVGLDVARHEGVRAAFDAGGVDPARLEFRGRVPLQQYFELHRQVDIAFDGFPYGGATTTLDSLWMGVPTLTLAGTGPMSRSAASILATLGMEDWIARDADEIAALAARHAAGLPQLATLRAGLRQRLERSLLMDAPRFTHELEQLYERMWLETAARA